MKGKCKVCQLIYIIIPVMLVIYLMFANQIVLAVTGMNHFEKTNQAISNYHAQPVFWAIDSISATDDMMDSFFIGGWAFCETKSNNDSKVIGIILSDGDKTYQYITPTERLINRRDLLTPDQEIFLRGESHGFYCMISAVGLPMGDYDIYIFDWENGIDYGIDYTGYCLAKDRQGVLIRPWQSRPVEEIPTRINTDAVAAVDRCEVDADGVLSIYGWAMLSGMETKGQMVYVKVLKTDGSSAVYTSLEQIRTDLGAGNALYYRAGFKALIPPGFVTAKDEIAELEIYIVNEDGWHTSEQLLGAWR